MCSDRPLQCRLLKAKQIQLQKQTREYISSITIIEMFREYLL